MSPASQEVDALTCAFDGQRLTARLTPPKGFLVSDALLSDAFATVMSL